MAELKLSKIKSIYGDLKGLLSQIPSIKEDSLVREFIVNQINSILDNLTNVSKSDFSDYKIPESERNKNWPEKFSSESVRTQLGRVISRLESEYGFGKEQDEKSPGIYIFNKNENEVSLKINYTINDLVKKYSDQEVKDKLNQLETELDKPNKNWDTIKQVVIWILNFSKELFLKIIPIILQKKL